MAAKTENILFCHGINMLAYAIRVVVGFVCACILGLSCEAVFFQAAAQVPSVGESIDERQHSRQQQLRENFQDELRRGPKGLDLSKLPEVDEVDKTGHCVEVNKVVLNGLQRYKRKKFQSHIEALTGRCVYLVEINNLLRLITNRFIKDGYVTSRAILPEQDLNDGILQIDIIEGRVSEVISPNGGFSKRQLAFAFPTKPGKRLNLRDIEQGIEQLSLLGSNNPGSDIQPGEVPGTSAILIENNPARNRFRGRVSFDNSGQESTGIEILSASLSADNLLGVNDLWFFSGNTEIDEDSGEGARGVNAFLTVPFGYFTAYASGGYFEYKSEVPVFFGRLENDGTSWNAALGLDWLLYRDATRKLSLTSEIRVTDNDNFIQDIRLLASSYRLTVLGLGVDYQERIFGGVFAGDIEWRRGTNLLGAESIFTGDVGPQSEFNKLEYNFSFSRPIKIWKLNTFYSGRVSGQVPDSNLFSAERISVGSPAAVRGFRTGGLSGDEGVFWRNDLTFTNLCCEFLQNWNWGKRAYNGLYLDNVNLSAFVGFDMGQIRRDNSDAFERGVLRSVTVGTNLSVKNIDIAVSVSHGFDHPFFIEPENAEVNASIAVNF